MPRGAATGRRSLKRRIIVPLAGSMTVLLCAFVLLFTWSKQRELEAVRTQDRAAVEGVISARVRADADMMRAVLRTVLLDASVVDALRARDRERLRATAAPLHAQLAREHDVTLFTFFTPDGTPFLDIADAAATPRTGGATLARARAGEPMPAGIEPGPARAPLSLRVVTPCYADGALIGYIELGQGLQDLGPALARVYDVDVVVTLEKRHLDRQTWEATAAAGAPTGAWERFERQVVLYQSMTSAPATLGQQLAGGAAGGEFQIEQAGRRFFASILPLRDVDGREVGQVTVLRDHTALLAQAWRSIAAAALVAFAIMLASAWLLYRAVRQHFLEPLLSLHATAQRRGTADTRTATILDGYDSGDLADAIDGLMGDIERAHEERTRRIVDTALDAVVTYDEHHTIIDWNSQAEKILGWTAEEAVGRTLIDHLVPPESRAAAIADMATFLATGESRAFNRRHETLLQRSDGSTVPVEVAITPIREDGHWIFSAFIRDITERARVEDALRASDARFRRLVELANVVPWEADAESLRFGYVDPRIVKLLGYPASEWNDASWMEHIHPEDREAAVGRIRDAIARRAEVEIEYRMVAAEGVAWIRDIVSADQAGAPTFLLRGFRFDTTERKRLEEQLYGSQKMEAIGRLAGGVAHDFNNLTTAILGYAGFVHSQLTEDDPLRDEVNEITRAAQRAADLTQQLLAFARRRVIQPRVVGVGGLVRSTEKMLRRLIGENIALRTESPDDLWPIRVDPGQFEQVLVNLAVNARDAMPNGGSLLIEMANAELRDSPGQRPAIQSGPYVMIAVSDTGIGMDDKTKARIFEPFFTTKRVGEGTGLGLASCYGIIKQAGGYIWAFSEIGKGTTLRIYLPRADETPVEEAGPEPMQARPTGNETILVAEDQSQVRRLAERALRARGYTVLAAENGEHAIEVAREFGGTIHLLLSDIVMPVLGGRDAARRIRADRPDIRVLYMSGYSEQDVLNPGSQEDDAVGFLPKPFTPRELEVAVRAALDATATSLLEAV
jgi:two-component system, cell cycle sensor histidine kinase and response regulator CckA